MSTEIIVKTKEEFEKLPLKFETYTRIKIVDVGQPWDRLEVKGARENASVEAWGHASVVAWENASVVAWENASVVARENASVEAWGHASVVAWENASVVARDYASVVAWENASVVARDYASVVARDYASVEARDYASVVARDYASVEARDYASVVARDYASVEAWGHASVVAWENASVVAWGHASVVARENASVEARENASVVAWDYVGVRVASDSAAIELFAFAAAWLFAKAKVKRHGKQCTVINAVRSAAKTLAGWLDRDAVTVSRGKAIIYKRVSKDFKTQEGTSNETAWTPGSTLEHPNWQPQEGECGPGKFHAVSRPYFGDEFRQTQGDRYVAIEVAVVDLHYWGPEAGYPHKIAFRKGRVLREVNRLGKDITA